MAVQQQVADAISLVSFGAGVGTGLAAALSIISAGAAILVAVLSVVALTYSIRIKRREWNRGQDKEGE